MTRMQPLYTADYYNRDQIINYVKITGQNNTLSKKDVYLGYIISICINMEIPKDKALVLEGGGMRGIFTCGVLDYMMDHQIRFPYVIGVSAGACNGLSYMSGQRGRARYSNIDLLEQYHYIGIRYLLKKHSLLDYDLLFKEFPDRILPYDFETYSKSPERFVMVTTNCVTGEANYFEEKKDKERMTAIARASSSLPFVCPITYIDGVPMLDGGIVDSIPVVRAFIDGYSSCLAVLTRNRGYRKKSRDINIPSFIYRRYPNLRRALSRRIECYNEQLEMVERMEDEGRITVIRPQHPMEVDRIEQNTTKLSALYEEGYAEAKRIFETVINP